ncbi:MAG: hypothetical protein HWE10_02900 [Gammaproteobacteria bacterium]|nr:hypothetical protein [Gammaproteobacteria bacterium]
MNLIKLCLILWLLSTPRFAYALCEIKETELPQPSTQCFSQDSANKEIARLKSKLTEVLIQQESLRVELKHIQSSQNNYQTQLNRRDSAQSSWYSILLTSVAVIVAVLGGIIAAIALIGAKEVKAAAAKIAEEKAQSHVQKTLPIIVTEELNKHFGAKEFFAQVREAVEVVAHRGISRSISDDEEEMRKNSQNDESEIE